jgi:hypothetical protein
MKQHMCLLLAQSKTERDVEIADNESKHQDAIDVGCLWNRDRMDVCTKLREGIRFAETDRPESHM